MTSTFKFPTLTRSSLLILFITLFTAILRFTHLSQYPVSLNLDEVAIGYNAYSILKTGQDEYGTPFPIAFRSHDDYKAPLYIYLTSLSMALIGFSKFAVRFPSALFGTLTIPLLYLFLRQLKFPSPTYRHLPLLASFLLCISPWHITFSRAALETNLAVFFNLFGFWMLYRGLSQPRSFILATLAFTASLYTYHSSKIFLPPMLFIFFLLHHRPIIKHYRIALSSFLLLGLLSLPLILFSLTSSGQLRFQGTSVFSTPNQVEINRDQAFSLIQDHHLLQAKLFHNRYLAGTFTLLQGYFTHFYFDFLFLGISGPPQNHTPNVGLLYLWTLPFILAGFYFLIRHRLPISKFLIFWILLAPMASAFTWDVPSATRTEIILPTFQIATALAICHLFILASSRIRFLVTGLLILTITFFFFHFLHNYFYIAPIIHAQSWQYGYQQAVEYTKAHQHEYSKIIVSTNLHQPQNFWAFYTQYDPHTYINIDGGTVSGGFNETQNHFSNFFFQPIDWDDYFNHPDYLYVELADKFHPATTHLHTIRLPHQTQPFIIIASPPENDN